MFRRLSELAKRRANKEGKQETKKDQNFKRHSSLSDVKKELEVKDTLKWSEEEYNGRFEMLLKRENSGKKYSYKNERREVSFYTNVDLGKSLKLSIDNKRIDELYECSSSCTVKETSSSSPSMMYHQLVSLVLADTLPGEKAYEEKLGTYTPDLVWLYKGQIYVDVTSDNYVEKFNSIEDKVGKNKNILIVNKYSFKFNIKELDWLYDLSRENDSNDTTLIYEMVKRQADFNDEQMLYTGKTLDYMLNSDMIDDDSKSLNILINEFSKIDRIMLERDVQDVCRKSFEKFVDLSKDINPEDLLVSKHYCFPDSGMYTNMEVDIRLIYERAKFLDELGEEPDTIDELGRVCYSKTEVEGSLFYEVMSDNVRVHKKAYETYMNYPISRLNKKMNEREEFLYLLKEMKSFTKAHSYLVSRLDKSMVTEGGLLKVNKIYNKLEPYEHSKDDVLPDEPVELPFTMSLDPDHMSILKTLIPGNMKIIKLLSRNRDYQESRFKRKIVSALKHMYKDGSRLRVRHWENKEMYAELLVSGLIFEEDKGVVYVSYFVQDNLYRTEKWRLSDIENFETCSDRMIAVTYSVYSSTKSWETCKSYLPVAYRLLNENSWGASKWMKPLRYFSSSYCMGSPLTGKAVDKVIKEIKGEDKERLSFIMIQNIAKQKYRGYTRSKTPLFGFDYKDLGFECFMYDLCPKKTYGRKKHLKDTMNDLLEEVRLHDNNFSEIKEIYRDFERVISIKDRKERDEGWRSHLLMLDRLSEKTGTRFTYSPASTVMIWPILKKRVEESSGLQGSVPIISDLCTAKASFSPVSNRACMAVESITEIVELYKTASTSRMAIKIVHDVVELTMRMFDKNQVGGNREISILSSIFRILQSILEHYGKKLAESSGSDILDRPDKFGIVSKTMNDAYSSEHQAILTADQTRWGPNFSTITFGLMYLLTGRCTTEFYVPALSCLLSEFKIFELPVWIPEVYKRSTHIYSIPGTLARSHMGQGIFHRSSSFYHSLVLDNFRELALTEVRKEGVGNEDVMMKLYCTSDDVLIIAYLSSFRGYNIDDNLRIKLIKIQISRFAEYLKYFGIKTSDYKNILSEEYGEFNSFYFSRDGLGSNDLKFVNSLIESSTSGNFLRDVQGCYNAHDNALNSSCTEDTAIIIYIMNYIVRLRQWKMSLNRVGIPLLKDIKYGLPAMTSQDFEKTDWVSFLTINRFKRRARFEELRFETYNDVVKVEIEANMSSITNSSGISNHKNMVVRHSKDQKVIISMCPSFKEIGINGMSYEAVLRGISTDQNFFHTLMNGTDQPHVVQILSERSEYVEMFSSLTVKRSVIDNVDPLTLAISVLKPCKTIVNGFDLDMFIAHIYRRRPRYDDRSVMDVMKDSRNFRDAYIRAKEIVDDFSLSGGGVRKAVFVKTGQVVEYEQIINVPVGMPYAINQIETITYGILDKFNPNVRYVSTSTDYYGYMKIDLVNIKLSDADLVKRFQNPAIGPPMSKLSYQVSQLNTDLLNYESLDEWALFEYEYQKAFKNTTELNERPTVCFLNVYVREFAKSEKIINIGEDQLDYINLYKLPERGEEIRSYVSTELNMSIEKEEKIHKKDPKVEEDIASLMGVEIDEETRLMIENIFNMAEEESNDEFEPKQSRVSLVKEVYDEEEEGEDNDYFGLRTAFADDKSKIKRYSVPIDWRFIVASNNFTIKRLILKQLCQELSDMNIIKSRYKDVMEMSTSKDLVLYFDRELPKKLNNLVTKSLAKIIYENRCDQKKLLAKIMRNDYKNIELSDMTGLSFNLSITGKPKNQLLDRESFKLLLSEGRIVY